MSKSVVVRTVLSLSLVALLAGCAATALRPGAERIIVTKKEAPKSCKFLGAVMGEQGGSFAGAYTSNANLAQGALNNMRNNALELGANYVQLETDRAGQTGGGSRYGMHMGQTDVTMTGNAYRCNPEDIGL